jgi:hypothetical protein
VCDRGRRSVALPYSGSQCLLLGDRLLDSWAWLTAGDYFANGNQLLLPSLIASGIIGFSVGWSAYGRLRLLILLLSTASFCYWAFVPTCRWSHSFYP